MTVQQLMKRLAKLPPDAPVEAWDYEAEEFGLVIEATWSECGRFVLLIADASKKSQS